MILSRELGKRIWGGSTSIDNGGGGVSSDAIAGLLAGYATESWVDEHYISIDFFSRLFQAHGTENGSEIDVMPNDMETTITSVESMFGFWTNLYISALGSNGAAPAGISLGMLTDVNISGTPSAGQVLTFDAATQKWVNGNAQAGVTALANLTDVTLTSLQSNQILIYDALTQKWVNSSVKTINGNSIFGTGDIPASGGASGNYLPLSGGTISFLYSQNRLNYVPLWIERPLSENIYYGSGIALTAYQGKGFIIIGSSENLSIKRFDGNTESSAIAEFGEIIKLNANVSFYNIDYTIQSPYCTGLYGYGNHFQITKRYAENSSYIDTMLDIDYDENRILFNNKMSSFPYSDGRYCEINVFGSIVLHTPTTGGGFAHGVQTLLPNNTELGYSCGALGRNNAIVYWFYGGSYDDPKAVITPSGNVGIGTTSPSYKLHVEGTIYATGAITALSDARKKDITGEAGVTVEQIAHAPAVQFLWKDEERRKDGQQVGTLAQYWRTVLPEVVMDKGGELSMQYGVAALVSSIIIARKVANHEVRIDKMEKWMKKWAEKNDE